jgi:hypothetical protein
MNTTFDDLMNALPHGSGIDSNWTIDAGTKSVRLHNSYHCMDENGFYDGWVHFIVSIPVVSKTLVWEGFKLHFQDYYRAKKYNLRDYLEGTVYDGLCNYFGGH